MIRTVKHKEKDYIVIDTTFQIKDEGRVIDVPFHLQLNTTKLDREDRNKAYAKASALFNHTISVYFRKPEKIESSSPWYKRIFK